MTVFLPPRGEKIVAEMLRRSGCFVIQSYAGDDANKAQKMQGIGRSYVIPDLNVARDGWWFWVEVKTKKEPTPQRETQIEEHGIPLHHWEDYREVQRITGAPVFLAIVEECSGAVLMRRLDSLGEPRTDAGTAFWPRANFDTFEKEIPNG